MQLGAKIVNEIAQEHIILVDENDNNIGVAEKISAHVNAQMHRAFSIFVFNSKGELMLQKRAKKKYHCGGLWSNTCCSHPRPNEPIERGIHRRLREEMGFDCPLEEKFSFKYKITFDNGLTENEYDHVFAGKYENNPVLNPAEADGWRWISLPELKSDIKKNHNRYTHWLKIAINCPQINESATNNTNDK
ncbi:isopentenyl-diphosphate delta-isomerase [Candidatus Falkowbacteria bacterium CG10_big_fil_rev_8_21_14_0_10_43_10]|uniref:Isopentenyl-diphosphate delta-isomerase n=1 Tax=Candidatus Falkowbacteria bacterium CG10_big_fil_rev_8_21_14_0_10_43_10 TaxID=1974567 RepID=A0A2H0V1E4_9BACT|nr:MAG: isopentenyl-diphosphate delta-isomerase [Candidatus Falkowbacteria bacterium CG10_big_fil_rev_8_21_14_0_10_43_10]